MKKKTVVATVIAAVVPVALAAAACSKTPAEPSPDPNASSTGSSLASAALANPPPPTPAATPSDPSVVKSGGSDPLNGKWALADATKDIKGTGALLATIETPKGKLTCKLYEDKAPTTVANFVGLAMGTRPWRNWRGDWVKLPAYDGTTFHRIIKGFMIQGGDAIGPKRGMPGTGEPGYTIPDEVWPGATHDKPGLICMANRGPNTNGAQFFILDAPYKSLDSGYTIFGECSPVDTIHDLASWPVQGDQAVNPPVISRVTVAREKPAK
jgi:peptidyl-prolyl cis-trans isomerase A (cyclophilin A)